MHTVTAQQLLHGYRGGHTQIAGSTRLSARDADLVTRLSDLSGSLSSGIRFDSYLTCYPVPTREFYAVARTWPDSEAPRSGCVLTHTFLIPMDEWTTLRDVRGIDRHFRDPRVANDDDFRKPLIVSIGPTPVTRSSVREDDPSLVSFISRYFAEGVRPVVWFDPKEPEHILWQLLQMVWPRLRERFCACTFSLQQRTADDGPFDLLFAPSVVFSRFTKLPPEHLIGAGSEPNARPGAVEPWCRFWAKRLAGDDEDNELFHPALWQELGEDPTGLRKMFLIEELSERATRSPTAGVGAIDVVESLARKAESAVPLKRRVIDDAIAAATNPESVQDGLSTLGLIHDRLRRDSFRLVAPEANKHLASAAQRVAVRAPDTAAALASQLLASARNGGPESPLMSGVMRGLKELAEKDPKKLTALRIHTDVAVELIRQVPGFVLPYYEIAGAGATKGISDWLDDVRDTDVVRAVRGPLLPRLLEFKEYDVLSRILRDLPETDLPATLTVLSSKGDRLADAELRHVVIHRLATAHPDEVRAWAASSHDWSTGIATVTAATYSPNRKGLVELLDDNRFSGSRKASVLARAIESVGGGRFPYWLREIIEDDLRVVEILLLAAPTRSPDEERVLHRAIAEVPDVPVARSEALLDAVRAVPADNAPPGLLAAAVRSAIREFVDGRRTAAIDAFTHTPGASKWLGSVPEWDLTAVLLHDQGSHADAVGRAWQWVAESPPAVFSRRPSILPAVCDTLLHRLRARFPAGVEVLLRQILHRAGAEAGPDVRLELSGMMLRLAFDNVKYPLSGVVADAFADVYLVVIKGNRPPSFLSSLFGWYDWDQGKDLRVTLIDAFLRSSWPPGDLAIAAHNADILRKVFKRVYKLANGEQYIRAMQDDLARRSDTSAKAARESLAPLIASPNFYEEWD